MNAEWNKEERKILGALTSPFAIHLYLEECAYRADTGNQEFRSRSPRWVMKERKAHCFEGALFAAAALQELGYDPLILDLGADRDDDHVIAPFKYKRSWGSISKSNFPVLLFREPVYKNLRELVMSYFDFYFNSDGEKTLRTYSLPLNLRRFDSRRWRTSDENMEYLTPDLEYRPHYRLISKSRERDLGKVEGRVYRAGLMGVDVNGLYATTRQFTSPSSSRRDRTPEL